MHGSGAQSAKLTIGGKEVNINIDLGNKAPVGPLGFSSDAKRYENAVTARSERDIDSARIAGSSAQFSNPTENVHKLSFKEGMRVADLGSGSGAYTLALSRVVGHTGAVYTVDIQRDLLTRTQNQAVAQGYENVHVVWGDLEKSDSVGIKDTSLDGALLANTLFQLEDKITAVKEAWRILKPGGTLAVIDWSDSHGGLGPQQSAVVTQPEAVLLCNDNGFALKSEFPAGEHHYGLLFVKVLQGEEGADIVEQVNREESDFISKTIAQELI